MLLYLLVCYSMLLYCIYRESVCSRVAMLFAAMLLYARVIVFLFLSVCRVCGKRFMTVIQRMKYAVSSVLALIFSQLAGCYVGPA